MSRNRLNVIIGANLAGFEQQIKGLERRINKFSRDVQRIGMDMSAAFTLPLVALGAGAVKAAADFEQAMSEVKAVSGVAGDEFDALQAKAKELGATTSKTATEAAQGLKFLALAGFDAATQLEAIEPVLRLSEAAGIDLALASDLATDAMSALGLKANELEGFLDIVAKTSTKSNTSIQQLGEAFVEVGGTFKNLRTPLNEANALLGVLANRGIKGSEAGTGLQSLLVNLTTGAGQAGVAMRKLNISAFDSQGNFKGISTVLKELNEKLSTLTEKQATTYKAMIGGKTRITELNALLDGMKNEFDDLNTVLADSDGALMNVAKTMQDNFKGQITRLKSALEGLGIQIGDIIIPFLGKLADKIQGVVEFMSKLDEETKKNIVVAGALVAAIGPLLVIIGKMTSIFSLAALGARNLIGVIRLLGASIVFLTSPIGIAVAAVAALAAGIVYAYRKSETFRGVINGLVNVMMELVRIAKEALGAVARGFAELKAGEFRKAASSFGEAIVKGNPIGVALTQGGRLGEAFADGFADKTDKIGGALDKITVKAKAATSQLTGTPTAGTKQAPTAGTKQAPAAGTKQAPAARPKGTKPVKIPKIPKSADLPELKEADTAKLAFAELNPLIKDFTPLTNQASEKAKSMGGSFSDLSQKVGLTNVSIRQMVPALAATEKQVSTYLQTVQGWRKQMERLGFAINEAGAAVPNLSQIAADGISGIGKSFEGAISGVENFGQSFLKVARQVIKAVIQQGVATAILNSLRSAGKIVGPVAIAFAGAAGASASGIFDSVLGRIRVPKLARGGIVPSGFPGDTFPALLSSNEVVAPLDRLPDLLNIGDGMQAIRLTGAFEISGSNLVLALDRTRQEKLRIG